MNRKTAIVALLAMTVQITACSGILTSDTAARQNYLLEPYTGYSGADTGEAWPVLVISVSAVPGLDTDHIQALGTDARLIQYANARWADFLPEVLTSLLRRSIASTGRFEAVKTKPGNAANQWSLELEVQQFYGILDAANGTSSVQVRFEGNLHCHDQEHRLRLNASKPVQEDRLAAVVRAHQQALDDTSRQLMQSIMDYCK
jgi:ABC-type uncharacterized transport system auxiliary subunit